MDFNKCLKILDANQIRQADQFTIQNEPISSIDLMERASETFVLWFIRNFNSKKNISIFCGTGNNGGDGLVIGRLLRKYGFKVDILIVGDIDHATADCQSNYYRVKSRPRITHIKSESDFPVINKDTIVVDAILGSGLNRPVDGLIKGLILHINSSESHAVVAVDIASGLGFVSKMNSESIIRVTHTFTFEVPKLAHLLPENEPFTGKLIIKRIGLDRAFINTLDSNYFVSTRGLIRSLLKKRLIYSHKGNFGKALLIAGSVGKMGAAVLAARACMRSGAGLLTAVVPETEYAIIQIGAPEAMAITPDQLPQDLSSYDAVAIGPGIGQTEESRRILRQILENATAPVVIDADGLNILSSDHSLLALLPKDSILTPHPGEFRRLVGDWTDDYHRLQLQLEFATKHQVIVLLKGANTSIGHPNGVIIFNPTGNAGMATGGSGDVLTGILLGLLAQGYEPFEAAVVGAYLHGFAGDLYASAFSQQGLIASDLIENVPMTFNLLLREL